MTETRSCGFKADMMVKTSGGAYRRLPDVECIGQPGHERGGEGEMEHEFLAADNHTFGVSFEKGRYVTRR